MKFCKKCEEEKDVKEFSKNSHKKDGLQTICKKCSKTYFSKYYDDNREKHKKDVSKRKKIYRKTFTKIINSIKIKYGCKTCKETEVCCLDFHHLDNNKKKFNISDIYGNSFSIEKIIIEINKCVVLCSNCHRKVHANLIKVNESMLCVENIASML